MPRVRLAVAALALALLLDGISPIGGKEMILPAGVMEAAESALGYGSPSRPTASRVAAVDIEPGVRMPLMGMGLGVHLKGDAARRAVTDALAAGIRHVESAHEYENEEAIGAALRGSNVPREEIFITSKCCHNDPCDFTYEAAWAHVNRTLKDLGVEYVDHYAVHVPGISDAAAAKCGSEGRRGGGSKGGSKGGKASSRNDDGGGGGGGGQKMPSTSQQRRRAVWRAMEEIKDAGLARSVGVSNFQRHHLEDLLNDPRLRHKPVANSVEWHPMYHDTDLREFCAARGITLTAFGSLPDYTRPVAGGGGKGGGGGGGGGGAKAKKAREVLERVAKGQGPAGVTAAQVTLRWATQRGVPVIPRSKSPQHLAQNVESLNLKLSDDDMASIDGLRVKSGAKKVYNPHFLTMP